MINPVIRTNLICARKYEKYGHFSWNIHGLCYQFIGNLQSASTITEVNLTRSSVVTEGPCDALCVSCCTTSRIWKACSRWM